LDGWDLIDRRGDGASIGVVSHPSSEDNAVLALHYPGNPALGADDFRNPAYAVEVATPSDTPLHYGRYEVSVRFASCAADEELVNGIFTYFNDGSDENGNGIGDNSEIDIELLCGEPHLLWLTVWTDYESSPTTAFRKTTRVIDMRTGNYHQTRPGMEGQYDVAPAGNLAAVRETDFPNPDRFYVLGFDWQPGYVRYYAVLGGTEVELFNLEGMNRVPQRPSRFLLNLWHAHVHWLKGGSADYPEASSTMHVDSVRIWQQ
jgi:beta-glucanase (GH16 family)